MTLGLSTLTTGFSTLDTALGGLRPAELVILSSRPGMRKTEFCLQLASHVAHQGQIAAYISLYQDQQEITQQILAIAARVPLYRIKSGDISPSERDNLSQKMLSLPDQPLWIETPAPDQPVLTLETIGAKLKDLQGKQDLPLGLVVVDYLQLIDSDAKEQGEIVIPALQDLAKQLNCPILGVTQLDRSLEERTVPRPTLYDLKQYHSAVDQDADVNIFLHRPQQGISPVPQEPVELIVSRKDHTKATTLTLRLDHELHCFWEQGSDAKPDPFS